MEPVLDLPVYDYCDPNTWRYYYIVSYSVHTAISRISPTLELLYSSVSSLYHIGRRFQSPSTARLASTAVGSGRRL